MKNNHTKKPEQRLTAALLLTYFILIMVAFIFKKYLPFVRLYLWNIFLAFLPLLFAILISKSIQKKRKIFSILFSFLWVIMFPNGPYMITDLAHLNLYKISFGFTISTFHSAWLGFLFAIFAVIDGVMMGMLSLYFVNKFIKNKFGVFFSWIFILFISVISGLGIYIGRFMRLNSWDIFKHPLNIINMVTMQLNAHTLGFVILFAIMNLALYWLFYLTFNKK